MKNLREIIQEKLKLKKDIKSVIDLDTLNDKQITLYGEDESEADEDMQDMQWDYCEEMLNSINSNYEAFIAFKYYSIMQTKERAEKKHQDVEPWMVETSLNVIKDKILTGRDLGYEVRLSGGHLEFDALNSGSRCTFYVYALTNVGYDEVSAYWEGVEEVPNLNFLYIDEKQKYITAIELK